MSWLAAWYPWIKAVHIIAVMSWMAGMLYLPRLFVYHADAQPGSVQSETFKTMERRLLRAIINPAMIVSILLGGLMAGIPGLVDWSSAWMWVKLAGVLGLVIAHHFFARWRKAFAEDRNRHPASFYRKVNEVPTLLMIVIVIMVVVKPF